MIAASRDTVAGVIISGESELHTASFHTGNGGTVSLSNGWLSVWYFNCDTHSFADGQKIVFKGDHPRLVRYVHPAV